VHRSEVTGLVGDRATAPASLAQNRRKCRAQSSVLAAHASLMESPAIAPTLGPGIPLPRRRIAFDDDGHGHRLSYLVENYLTLQE
jgi:hypothetical protein